MAVLAAGGLAASAWAASVPRGGGEPDRAGGRGPGDALARPDLSLALYVPIALLNVHPDVPPTPTPEPTSALPQPTPGASPTLVPGVPETSGDVLVQVATFGGYYGTETMWNGDMALESPWFTLYEDGRVIAQSKVEGYYDPVQGTYAPGAAADLLAVLEDDVGFFDLVVPACPRGTVTDQDTTHIYARAGGRERRLEVYGLGWYWPGGSPCFGGGTPVPVPEEMNRLRRAVFGLLGSIEAAEAFAPGSVTVNVAYRMEGGTAPQWPFDLDLLQVSNRQWQSGRQRIVGQDADLLVQLLAPAAASREFSRPFLQRGRLFSVAARIEFPGWGTYRR